MGIAAALTNELFQGVIDGRKEAIAEARHLSDETGSMWPQYRNLYKPIEVGPLRPPALGVTNITPEGSVENIRISSYIPAMGAWLAQRYNKTRDWARRWVYGQAKLTTEHELAHAQTSHLARGEGMSEYLRAIMETVPGYGKFMVALRLGKRGKAKTIKETTPYFAAWRLATYADEYYDGGYRAFMRDVESEHIAKPLWRLSKAMVKAGIRDMGEIGERTPAFAYAQ